MSGLLERRAAIVRAIRRYFDERDFTEVETSVWIAAPAPEEHIDCPALVAGGYLRASPELQMKKLLAAGMDRLYQLGPCFREGERGARHNPEFTMLEWYRKAATYGDIRADMEGLLRSVWPLKDPSETPRFATVRVRDAYRRWAGWDPWTDWDADRFDFDMATKVEPAIAAQGGGVFLTDYPVAAASLAKVAEGADGERHAERWELYWNGMELANCFTELCDEAEQRRRFAKAQTARRTLGEADYPLDEEFLCLLPLLGSAAGVALGVDRLVMVLTDAATIADVRSPLAR